MPPPNPPKPGEKLTEYLNRIRTAAGAVPQNPDAETADQQAYGERLAVDRKFKELELQSRSQDIDERRKYGSRIFWLLVVWIGFLFVVIFLQGFACHEFKLSDSVLIALVGGTTASVISIFVVVVKYLFPSKATGTR